MKSKDKFLGQTWKLLEDALQGKTVVLFGASAFASSFFIRYSSRYEVHYVADNDIRKQGMRLADVVGAFAGISGNVIIKGAEEALRGLEPNNTLIVIASLHYVEIGDQLEGLGFTECYAIPVMEAADLENGEINKEQIVAEDGRRQLALKFSTLPISPNKIVILMGNFGGHGKYITLALIKKELSLDIVWIIRNEKKEVPSGVRIVYEADWENYYREMETASVWIFDDMLPQGLIKRKEQTYIQTKHWASITLKTFYMDDEKYRNEPRTAKKSLHDAKWMDYIFSGSEFDEASCRTGYLFNGTFVRVGSPRTDAMFDPACREKVFHHFRLNKKIKLAIYAPTLRYIKDAALIPELRWQELDFDILKKALTERFGGEWKILLRVHPSVAIEASKKSFFEYKDVINTSFYEDSEELCSAADVMITDYSSIMFEPAFVGKPVFLYAPDRDEYINEERKLLLEYDKLPFAIAKTNKELFYNVINFGEKDYLEKLKNFFDLYGVKEDGNASLRAATFVINLLKGVKNDK